MFLYLIFESLTQSFLFIIYNLTLKFNLTLKLTNREMIYLNLYQNDVFLKMF